MSTPASTSDISSTRRSRSSRASRTRGRSSRSRRSNPRPVPARPNLFQLIRDLGDAGLRAGFVVRPAWGAAHTDAADGFIADLDRKAADRGHDSARGAKPRRNRIVAQPLREILGALAEYSRGIGLALRQLDGVMRRAMVAQRGEHVAAAID